MKATKVLITLIILAAAVLCFGINTYKNRQIEPETAVETPAAELIVHETVTETAEERTYRIAGEKMSEGEYRAASEAFSELGTYAESERMDAECREKLYESACEELFRCDFETAAENFEYLGGMKNSENYLSLCKERIELRGQEIKDPILAEKFITRTYDDAKMYITSEAMIYAPDECDENTAFFVFYPGGAAGEVYLPFQKVYDYVETNHPNAIMYFCETSGYCTYRARNEHVIDVLKQIAVEKNVVVHDLVVSGASAGVYTAIHAASDYYTYAGIPTWKVIALDAAMEWEDPMALSDEDLDIISANGTKLLLFEQPGVRDEKKQIHDMIDHDCYVTIVECREKLHNLIAYNSFKYGVFSYALEMCDESGLKEGEYTFINLNGE